MLQLIETNQVEVLNRRQTSEIKKKINLLEKRHELRELIRNPWELTLEEEADIEKVNK